MRFCGERDIKRGSVESELLVKVQYVLVTLLDGPIEVAMLEGYGVSGICI